MVAALAIVAVGALVVLQTSIAYRGNQNHESLTRLKGNTHLLLLNIAQRIKRGHDLATFRPDCAGFGVPLNVKTLPGHTAANPKIVCVRDATQVCTVSPEITGNTTPICASLANNKINWQIDANDTGGAIRFRSLSGSGSTAGPFDIRVKTVSITVPDRTDPIWRDCTGNTCVRMSLCPPGTGTCTNDEVQGVQTIMITGN